MKVALVNRDHSRWEGGDKIKVKAILSSLRERNIDVHYCPENLDGYDYDLVHLFHISYPYAFETLCQCRERHFPLVVSTIYSGEKILRASQQAIADYSSRLIFMSPGELDYVRSRININHEKVVFLENGIAPAILHYKPGNNGFTAPIVLCIGRIHPQKNQINLALACRRLRLPLVCIGQVMDISFARRLEKEGAWLLPHIGFDELSHWYRRAKVVACVSVHEVAPNIVQEAAMFGSNIVLTDKSCTFTDLVPLVWLCDPFSVDSITQAVDQASKTSRSSKLRELFKTRNWSSVATKLEDIYTTVLVESVIETQLNLLPIITTEENDPLSTRGKFFDTAVVGDSCYKWFKDLVNTTTVSRVAVIHVLLSTYGLVPPLKALMFTRTTNRWGLQVKSAVVLDSVSEESHTFVALRKSLKKVARFWSLYRQPYDGLPGVDSFLLEMVGRKNLGRLQEHGSLVLLDIDPKCYSGSPVVERWTIRMKQRLQEVENYG